MKAADARDIQRDVRRDERREPRSPESLALLNRTRDYLNLEVSRGPAARPHVVRQRRAEVKRMENS